MQTRRKVIILLFKLLNLAVTLADCVQQLCIGGLTLQEALDECIYIGDTCRRLDSLESFVNRL